MTEQLKPCPFCGSLDTRIYYSGVECAGCGASTWCEESTEEQRIAAWNRRANEPAPTQAGAVDLLRRSVVSIEAEATRNEERHKDADAHDAHMRAHAERQTVALEKIAAALFGPEVYRRALDVAIAGNSEFSECSESEICDMADRQASERERRSK